MYWKKRLLPVVIALLALAVAVGWTAGWSAPTTTCNVPSGDYPTIQSAVDDPACDVVNVATGIFIANVVISRTMTVQGQGAGNTIVDGDGAGSVFSIQA
ncbi:MAG: hypothetical protein L0322_06130, partial [Chloroflexi bacterium]|nr:hypothetical protein [Chloroflexota bacterium]